MRCSCGNNLREARWESNCYPHLPQSKRDRKKQQRERERERDVSQQLSVLSSEVYTGKKDRRQA